MKGISEAISTVIISSVIIMVSIMIFYIAINSLTTSMQVSEYGYMKSSMINIAASVPEIIKGTSISISVPKGTVGVGYNVRENIVYEVDVLTSSGWKNIIVDDSPSAIEIRSSNVVVTSNKIIYGVNNLTVNDIAFIPTIWEYYQEGASTINFNTSRFYIHIYNVTDGTHTEIYIRIYYLQLRPRYVSGPRTIMFVPGGKALEKQINNIEGLVIREINSATGETIRSYEPSHIFTQGYTVNLLLSVEQLYVVIT
ncbi:hypothetical protein [Staphylothermus hellenicus]|uniref:Uncharacterized protein n=1 Tax=Staphylothermus hellenicus (strain DSM 12710 / JCM 10830 / BK20S6-10-b1 / P8) TaxID=591019 RepID=D7D8I6_STAHD|nr:hypothetical protein [Staphylothermus hellenicus]ADI32082.1 hypothetical protein Shell_0976 [Staphylothermus hellenicus DSM 12710]